VAASRIGLEPADELLHMEWKTSIHKTA
jgi:hypothetical protein